MSSFASFSVEGSIRRSLSLITYEGMYWTNQSQSLNATEERKIPGRELGCCWKEGMVTGQSISTAWSEEMFSEAVPLSLT